MKHNKTRVLLVGKFSSDKTVYTYPTSFIDAFRENGCEVVTFNVVGGEIVELEGEKKDWVPASAGMTTSSNRLPREGGDPVLSKFFHILISKFPQSLKNYLLNRHLISTVRQHKPDIMFMIKGNMITANTLKQIKSISPHTHIMHFYPDNPFCFWNGNSNKNVLDALPYIDTFLIWSKELIPVLHAVGCKNVKYFPFAVDEKVYYPWGASDPGFAKATPGRLGPRRSLSRATSKDGDDIAFPAPVLNTGRRCNAPETGIIDALFVGTWDTEREQMLEQVVLALPNLNLAIWGNRWDEYLPPSSILRKHLRGKAIYKKDLLHAFANSKIVLNFIRPQNMQAHNMRTFEALAARCFLLTQDTAEQSQPPFIPDYNIAIFDSAAALIKKIAFYVNQDSLRNDVAMRGYELVHGFTLHARISALLAEHSHKEM